MDATRRASLFAFGAAPLALAACATAQTPEGFALTPAAYAAWLDRYKQAWEAKDVAAAGALFTADATYHEMPFDAPMQGRAAIEEYWTRVTASQSNIAVTTSVIMCAGDEGVSHWHAAFTGGDSSSIELDGVFVCRFVDAETASSLREWWHIKVTPAA